MVNEETYDYCIRNSSEEPKILSELRRETFLKTVNPQMISGELQGQILTMLVKMIKPAIALEIGTFTGYASLCIAKGMDEDGLLYTIERDEELAFFHNKYFGLSKDGLKIKSIYGDANDVIPNLDLSFDFVFMDAGKKDYQNQYEMILQKMKKGGVILADNVLWKLKVLEVEKDKMTQYIHDFNLMVSSDARVSNVILPIRDGVNIIMIN